MPCIINAESGTGLTNSADGSGLLKVQSGGKTTNALAWVNFNGTGTVAIRSSYNVSSITDNGTGDYTVNFATALSDANYAANMSGARKAGNTGFMIFEASDALGRTASTIRMLNTNQSAQAEDNANLYLSIFGN